MIKTTLSLFGFLFYAFICFSQTEKLSNRVANYDMQVSLDPTTKEVAGQQKLTWNNPSGDTIFELQYHLYLNAFKNSQSTFMKERGIPRILGNKTAENCEWGWIDILSIKDQNGRDLTTQMEYIHPDDDNTQDRTVLRVPLIQPVLPHQSTTIELDWISHVPRTMARTGYNRDFYFMAQWFPKVGVYEPAGMRFAKKGQWNCHQYHSSGEYYANFGVYNVDISVPEDFVVGASGLMTKEVKKNARKVYSFSAEDVIDFAWTASPHFEVIEEQWKGVQLRLLSYSYNKHFSTRYFTAIKQAMTFFDENIGAYPYPILTLVNPPLHGIFCSGMEYPMLITMLGNCALPTGVKTPEIIAIHEFVHQYFMQMVATNEQEEAWMDEGITNYYESRLMNKYYGENTSTFDFMGITYGNMESNRASYFSMDNPQIAPNSTYSWNFKHGGYHEISYTKTTLWLQTLSGIVGLETMDEIIKTYFQRWKFNHPCANDFTDVVNEVVTKKHGNRFGENFDWFFDQVLYGTALCDYAVSSISNQEIQSPFGVFDGGSDCIKPSEEASQHYKSKVILHRLEDMKLPVDVLVHFDDETSVKEYWDGKNRSKEFSYAGTRQISNVEIDPERKIYIDKNFTNNSMTVEVQKTGIRKYCAQLMVWMQNAMQTMAMFI